MPDAHKVALAVVTSVVLFGTIYSVFYETYLDTSNPILTHLPHPLHHTHYFASKANVLNVYFIKRLWVWTSAAFAFLYFTTPRTVRRRERVFQYLTATAVWLAFSSWFFGPPVLERLNVSTGGECILTLPSGALVTIPHEYCFTKSTISTTTHARLFPASLLLPDSDWNGRPRLRKGHDVSGHIFLLTMSILFLVDQLRSSFASGQRTHVQWSPLHKWAVIANMLVIALSFFAIYTTSVYFHTPVEKLSGFLIGVAGFYATQLPIFQHSFSVHSPPNIATLHAVNEKPPSKD